MTQNRYMNCIIACYRCAAACDHCSVACLSEEDPSAMSDCIRADMDCAQICRLAAAAMARNSDFVSSIWRLCAEICDACASICEKYEHDHCQDCAKACRACADECATMAG